MKNKPPFTCSFNQLTFGGCCRYNSKTPCGNSNFEILIFLKIELVIHLENDCLHVSLNIPVVQRWYSKKIIGETCKWPVF